MKWIRFWSKLVVILVGLKILKLVFKNVKVVLFCFIDEKIC